MWKTFKAYDEFKTGEAIESEINRVLQLGSNGEMDGESVNSYIEDLLEYSFMSNLISRVDNQSYYNRKNNNRDGSERTHLQFFINLKKCQKREHEEAFMPFFNWLKEKEQNGKNRNIRWEYHGSDEVGYIMIVNFSGRGDNPLPPDYKITIDNKIIKVEAKSFRNIPCYKLTNLRGYVKEKAYVAMFYNGKNYYIREAGLKYLLNDVKNHTVEYGRKKVIKTNQKYIDEMIEEGLMFKFGDKNG